ncbi:hypothetical protein IAU59_000727 [Kwoniella sp. CBS 9459]
MDQLLAGQVVLLAEGQFSDSVIDLVKDKVTALGGTLTTQRDESTILLVNPSHPQHAKEKEQIAYLTKNYPQVTQPEVYPYHWLACCFQAGRLLKLEELALVSPIFTYPATSEDWRPLRVWVSVNLAREDGENPEQARDNCAAQLEAGGGLAVPKRALADVLVVDETSNFAKKVHAEKKAHGRDWQRIVERDWVDGCLRSKTLAWRTAVAPANAADEDEQDSMAEDDMPIGKGKGLGRPTGKPRTEYTPEDDDFVTRWLAAHHPNGSWSSRKTYLGLVEQSAKYPYAGRHTAQSWHERFKKNSVAFEKRIKRLIVAGVDGTLKTKAERIRTRELKALQEQENQAATAHKEATTSQPEAGPSKSRVKPPAGDVSAPVPAPNPPLASAPTSTTPQQAAPPEPSAASAKLPTPVTAEPSEPTMSAKAGHGTGNKSAAGRAHSEAQQSTAANTSTTTSTKVAVHREESDQIRKAPPLVPKTEAPTTAETAVANKVSLISEAPDSTGESQVSSERPPDGPVITITGPANSQSEAASPNTPTEEEEPSQPASQSNLELGESLSDLLPSPSQFLASVNIDPASQPDPASAQEQRRDLTGDRAVDTDLFERDLIEGQLEVDEDSQSTSAHASRRTRSRDDLPGSTAAGTGLADGDVEMSTEKHRMEVTNEALSIESAKASAEAQDDTESPDRSDDRTNKNVRLNGDVEVAAIQTDRAVHPSTDSGAEASISTAALATRPAAASADTNGQSATQPQVSVTAQLGSSTSQLDRSDIAHVPAATTSTTQPHVQAGDIGPSVFDTDVSKSNTAGLKAVLASDRDPRTPPAPGAEEQKKRPYHSNLREHLESTSASRAKRLRSLDRSYDHLSRSPIANEADLETVYADVSLPPRPVRQTPVPSVALSPIPPVSSNSRRVKPPPTPRYPSPVLSEVQRAESVDRGRNIVLDQAREYKQRLSALSQRFGLTPSEIVAFMSKINRNNTQRHAKGQGQGHGQWLWPGSTNENGSEASRHTGSPWDEVERRLELRYGGGRRDV